MNLKGLYHFFVLALFEGAYMRHNVRYPWKWESVSFWLLFQDIEYQHRVYCVAVAARSTLNGSEQPVSKVGNGYIQTSTPALRKIILQKRSTTTPTPLKLISMFLCLNFEWTHKS